VADDHPLFVEAVSAALAADGVDVVGIASRGDEVVALVAETRPDVVLLDLSMPGTDGYACLQQLRARHPEIPVLVVSALDARVAARQVLAIGAAGFVGKTVAATELAHAVRVMLRKQPVYYALPPEDSTEPMRRLEPAAGASAGALTRRELEILQLVAEGMSNRAIARKLWITEQTAKFHVSNILKKLDATNRTEATCRADKLGLIREPDKPSPALDVPGDRPLT